MARRERIDRNIQDLVYILNRILEIKTYASCGGHVKPGDRKNPVPKGEFYVSFIYPLDVPESFERSISVINAAINVYNGKVVLEKDDFPPLKNGSSSWTISGKGVNLRDFTDILLREYIIAKKIPARTDRAGE